MRKTLITAGFVILTILAASAQAVCKLDKKEFFKIPDTTSAETVAATTATTIKGQFYQGADPAYDFITTLYVRDPSSQTSPQNTSQEQFVKLFELVGYDNAAAIAKVNEFITKCTGPKEAGPGIYARSKKLLEEILAKAHGLSVGEKDSTNNNIIESFADCAPGAEGKLRVLKAELYREATITGWLVTIRKEILDVLSWEHCVREQLKKIVQIHVGSAFSIYAASEGWGIPEAETGTETKDIFASTKNTKIDDLVLIRFHKEFLDRYNILHIAKWVRMHVVASLNAAAREQGFVADNTNPIDTSSEKFESFNSLIANVYKEAGYNTPDVFLVDMDEDLSYKCVGISPKPRLMPIIIKLFNNGIITTEDEALKDLFIKYGTQGRGIKIFLEEQPGTASMLRRLAQSCEPFDRDMASIILLDLWGQDQSKVIKIIKELKKSSDQYETKTAATIINELVESGNRAVLELEAIMPAVVSVGDSYGGGTVFCVSQTADTSQCVTTGSGDYGLIMANEDQTNHDSSNHGVTWSSAYKEIGPSAQSMDNGAANTAAIIAAFPQDTSSNNAAHLCHSYRDPKEGHTDWYLPSKNELNKMYLYAKANNLIGEGCSGSKAGGVQCFVSGYDGPDNLLYWSSSEYSGYSGSSAWAQAFSNGYQGSGSKIGCYFGVRAVRAFNNSTI